MRIKTVLLTGAGLLLLALGAIGVAVPLLPTTPFVLASAYCLSGNPRLRGRIMGIPFVGEHMENYRSRRGLSRKMVLRSLLFLWVMLSLPAILRPSAWLALLLASVGLAVTAHILWMARAREVKQGGCHEEH